jgi:hypothetical protein
MRPGTAVSADWAGFAVGKSGVAAYRFACHYHQLRQSSTVRRKIRGTAISIIPKQNAQEWRAGDVDHSSLKHNRSFHAFRLPVEPEAGI